MNPSTSSSRKLWTVRQAQQEAMTTLVTYTLQVFSPTDPPETTTTAYFSQPDKRVLANLPAMIESIEEDFTDLLPEGYSVRIREWQEEAVTE